MSEAVAAPPAASTELAKPAKPRRPWSLLLLPNEFPALHGLRVLAIVSVVQHHVTDWFRELRALPPRGGWPDVSEGVWFGMDLFFILSGFLIGTMLLAMRAKPSRPALGRFYLRRSFRIMPQYYLVLTLLAFWLPRALHRPLSAGQRANLVFEYVYLTNYLPTLRDTVMHWGWSLAVEEHFYLAVPLLLLALKRWPAPRARLTLLAALWASAPVLRALLYLAQQPTGWWELYQAQYGRTHTRYDALVAGLFLATLRFHHREAVERWLAAPRARAALLGTSALAFALLLQHAWQKAYPLWNVVCWGTLTALAWGPLIVLLTHRPGRVGRALGHPLFRAVATLGYGVYLVHIPVLLLVCIPPLAVAVGTRAITVPTAWGLALAGTMLVSLALAYALHVLVDKPMLWLRDRVAGDARAPGATPDTAAPPRDGAP